MRMELIINSWYMKENKRFQNYEAKLTINNMRVIVLSQKELLLAISYELLLEENYL